jgi:flagellar motor switch protein FliN/FliY
MTDAASNPPKLEFTAWFDAWKSCTQDVLSQISGQPNTFEVVTEPHAAPDSELRYTVSVSGNVTGEMSLRLSPASALRLARKFLGEPEPASGEAGTEISSEQCEALEELLRQIGGLAATAIGGKVGGPVQMQLARAEQAWAWSAGAAAMLRTRDEAGTEIALEIGLSPELAKTLSENAEAKAVDVAIEAAAPPENQVPPEAVAPPVSPLPAQSSEIEISTVVAEPPPGSGYHRLLDVGLGVKLRFGTRRMLLRDVLGLSSGLVVELDNKLNSPVDLLLDGRVIARGEVVVIDGKYGMRVTDVVDSSPPSSVSV